MEAATTTADVFPFLKLPTELRLMVYEHIEVTTTCYTLKDGPVFRKVVPKATDPSSFSYGEELARTSDGTASLALALPSLSVAILSTCHTIYDEAYPIVLPKLQSLSKQPLLIFGSPSRNAEITRTCVDILCICIKHAQMLESPPQFHVPPMTPLDLNDLDGLLKLNNMVLGLEDVIHMNTFINKVATSIYNARHARVEGTPRVTCGDKINVFMYVPDTWKYDHVPEVVRLNRTRLETDGKGCYKSYYWISFNTVRVNVHVRWSGQKAVQA